MWRARALIPWSRCWDQMKELCGQSWMPFIVKNDRLQTKVSKCLQIQSVLPTHYRPTDVNGSYRMFTLAPAFRL
jgi:hypothetical protein